MSECRRPFTGRSIRIEVGIRTLGHVTSSRQDSSQSVRLCLVCHSYLILKRVIVTAKPEFNTGVVMICSCCFRQERL